MQALTRKLGKRAPAPANHEARRLASTALRSILPAIPDDSGAVDPKLYWPLFLNNQLGCCVIAAKALLTLRWSRWAGQGDIIWPDAAVLAAYEKWGGYVPGNPASDGGCVMQDVNEGMVEEGWPIGLQAPEVWTLHNQIDHTSIDDLARSISIFGAIDCGWVLTRAMLNSTDGTWPDVTGSPDAGGHDAILVRQRLVGSKRVFTALTWSQEWDVPEETIRASMDEAHLGVSRQHMLAANEKSPGGEGMDMLLRYAGAMRGT